MNDRELFDKYFVCQPAMDDLVKATYAYHTLHNATSDAHLFRTVMDSDTFHSQTRYEKMRDEECEWCGRSRREIRFDSLPAHCESRPQSANESISWNLHEEEKKMFALLEAGPEKLQKVLREKFDSVISADALFYFQTSLGYEPDIVSTLLDVEVEKFMEDYDRLMAEHKAKSGKFQK